MEWILHYDPYMQRARYTFPSQSLIRASDCRTCHTIDVKAVGPAFKQIAEKYNGKPGSKDSLAHRIIKGSTGIWGTDNNMPAHPSMSRTDARTIASYILNINNETLPSLPGKGKYTLAVPPDDNGRGTYILRVAYYCLYPKYLCCP